MYRFILFNKRDEIISFKDHPSFEESLKNIYVAMDEFKNVVLSGAYIYKYLNPEVNQSMQMIASVRTIR